MARLMEVKPRIERLTQRKLIGKRVTMTFANNQTFKLWQSFMPRRKDIKNNSTSELFSIQVYPPSFDFTNLNAAFEKWAAIEVADFEDIPQGLEPFALAGGTYAVFEYKGVSSDTTIFEYIFGVWLQQSKDYLLDDRPHFEILGNNYRNNDPGSEEEIWIPVKQRQ
jgi:AraC family transcriptional regulator